MKRTIQIISSMFFLILSVNLVRADVVSPVQVLAFPVLAAVVIGVIALIAWLIIRKIKKKNVSKSHK